MGGVVWYRQSDVKWGESGVKYGVKSGVTSKCTIKLLIIRNIRLFQRNNYISGTNEKAISNQPIVPDSNRIR